MYISGLYYETLIENIHPDLNVLNFFSGSTVSIVETEIGIGISETVTDVLSPRMYEGATPIRLKTFAGMIRSRNYAEASLGLAAINAYYNNALPNEIASRMKGARQADPLQDLKATLVNKRIATIGHNELIEPLLGDEKALIVFDDHTPLSGGLPLAAMAFLCPDYDVVIADGKSLIRKQLPRLIGCTNHLVLAGIGIPAAAVSGANVIQSIVFYTVHDMNQTLHLISKGATVREIAESCRPCFISFRD
jgi:uncharacterized protein (DUF4213/DUF364 family)